MQTREKAAPISVHLGVCVSQQNKVEKNIRFRPSDFIASFSLF